MDLLVCKTCISFIASLHAASARDFKYNRNGTCLETCFVPPGGKKATNVHSPEVCMSPSSSAGTLGDLHPTGVWVVLSNLATRAFAMGHPRAKAVSLDVLT